MLDLHPEPQKYRTVDVRVGEDIRRAGRLYRRAFFLADIHAARGALEAISELEGPRAGGLKDCRDPRWPVGRRGPD